MVLIQRWPRRSLLLVSSSSSLVPSSCITYHRRCNSRGGGGIAATIGGGGRRRIIIDHQQQQQTARYNNNNKNNKNGSCTSISSSGSSSNKASLCCCLSTLSSALRKQEIDNERNMILPPILPEPVTPSLLNKQQQEGKNEQRQYYNSKHQNDPDYIMDTYTKEQDSIWRERSNERHKNVTTMGQYWNRIQTFFREQVSITGQQQRIHRAEGLLQALTYQANDPRWYGPGRVAGNEFRPVHAMYTIHLWLLHKRLISDDIDHDDTAMNVQDELFYAFWEDTAARIRKAGVNEWFLNRDLATVQKYTFVHLTHYDHIYTSYLDDPAGRIQMLEDVIKKHVYLIPDNNDDDEGEETTNAAMMKKKKDGGKSSSSWFSSSSTLSSSSSSSSAVDEENKKDNIDIDDSSRYYISRDLLNRMAWYIECNYQNIMLDWPYEYYHESRVSWIDIPDFTNIKDDRTGTIMKNIDIHPDEIIPEPWFRNITLTGVDYYWNPETMEATYDKPMKPITPIKEDKPMKPTTPIIKESE